MHYFINLLLCSVLPSKLIYQNFLYQLFLSFLVIYSIIIRSISGDMHKKIGNYEIYLSSHRHHRTTCSGSKTIFDQCLFKIGPP